MSKKFLAGQPWLGSGGTEDRALRTTSKTVARQDFHCLVHQWLINCLETEMTVFFLAT